MIMLVRKLYLFVDFCWICPLSVLNELSDFRSVNSFCKSMKQHFFGCTEIHSISSLSNSSRNAIGYWALGNRRVVTGMHEMGP